MAELKTKQTKTSVGAFLKRIEDSARRADCETVVAIMQRITGKPPKMWGTSMIGFGNYHYKYASGREGSWFVTGLAPRKQNLTLYIMSGFRGYPRLMGKLGKYKTGKSCLYIKSLSDVDQAVLEQLIGESVAYIAEQYP